LSVEAEAARHNTNAGGGSASTGGKKRVKQDVQKEMNKVLEEEDFEYEHPTVGWGAGQIPIHASHGA